MKAIELRNLMFEKLDEVGNTAVIYDLNDCESLLSSHISTMDSIVELQPRLDNLCQISDHIISFSDKPNPHSTITIEVIILNY